MLTDLRKINSIIEPMGALQLDIPSPSMIPQNWKIKIINLFFLSSVFKIVFILFIYKHLMLSISLLLYCQLIIKKKTVSQYYWKVLPQGILNSPTLCQLYVSVKHPPTMQETQVQFLGQEDLLEKEMAIHSNILAWKIPWTEEPGRLQSMGSQRVRHD